MPGNYRYFHSHPQQQSPLHSPRGLSRWWAGPAGQRGGGRSGGAWLIHSLWHLQEAVEVDYMSSALPPPTKVWRKEPSLPISWPLGFALLAKLEANSWGGSGPQNLSQGKSGDYQNVQKATPLGLRYSTTTEYNKTIQDCRDLYHPHHPHTQWTQGCPLLMTVRPDGRKGLVMKATIYTNSKIDSH